MSDSKYTKEDEDKSLNKYGHLPIAKSTWSINGQTLLMNKETVVGDA